MKQTTIETTIHLLICINDRKELKPSCGPEQNAELVKKLKMWVIEEGLIKIVKITKTGCLGPCPKKGGSVMVWPSKHLYEEVETLEDLKEIVNKELL